MLQEPTLIEAHPVLTTGLLVLAGVLLALRRLFGAGLRATARGVHLMGSFIRWRDIQSIHRERPGLVIRVPANRLFRRHVLKSLGWELPDGIVDQLAALRARHSVSADPD